MMFNKLFIDFFLLAVIYFKNKACEQKQHDLSYNLKKNSLFKRFIEVYNLNKFTKLNKCFYITY